ncbi:MAG: Lrp/AsnC ligand binding domain-containing protein [Halobacteriota archaeon]|jgi:energy-converting hydrogenase Eha subunit G
MIIGFTMMNVVRGAEYEVWQELAKISGVTRVVHVFGEVDYIIIIEVNEISELNQAVDDIRLIQGVTSTRTFVEHRLTFMK